MSAGTSLDARTEVQEPQGKPSAEGGWRRFAPYLLAVGLVVLVHSAIIIFERTPALDGQLYGTDGYMRLVRVTQGEPGEVAAPAAGPARGRLRPAARFRSARRQPIG